MHPTPRCLLLAALGFPLAALPVLFGAELWTAWVAFVAAAAALAAIDGLLSLPARRLELELEAPPRLYVGEADELRVALRPRSRSGTRRYEVHCDLAPLLRPQPTVAGEPGEDHRLLLTVPLVPLRRGQARVERVWARWTGPLGLMRRSLVRDGGPALPVVPNVKSVRAAALRFARERETASGQRTVRYVGEGSEFDAMREYVPGLDSRSISWRATARHRRLICQDYRLERNQQVIVAFDTGRLMSEPLDGMPKLDHAIHAGLLLAWTCLRAGDRVGLYAFDQGVRRFIAPEGGMRGFRRLQHATGELDYAQVETNFTLGLAELTLRLHRRSLVVLLTDFVDTVTAELMLENAARLARRHLIVFVTLRDPQLEATTVQAPASLGRLYEAVVAGDLVRERELVLLRLQRMGIYTIDTVPGEVSAQLLDRYLAIKRRELI